MPFKLRHLQYFITVAEEGQMTRAARKLHLAQPALSQAITHLESQLGIILLERQARGVSLTPAGELFFAKAQITLAASADAAQTAQSLARAARAAIAIGSFGSPPMATAPQLFAAFADAHPKVELSFRDLPFPRGSTPSWLEEVDVALCFSPTPHPGVRVRALRAEPRAVVVPESHPLAQRSELTAAEVLDETFYGFHPAVEPLWAGFWMLDDHRGTPPTSITTDRARNPLEMFALVASGRALTTFPASRAEVIEKLLRGVVAIPLHDAHPAVLSLVWRKDNPNPLVEALVAFARVVDSPEGRLPVAALASAEMGSERAL
jgi:DNA-binding transcriptional LysR family regulator